jgi:hypothetical protein
VLANVIQFKCVLCHLNAPLIKVSVKFSLDLIKDHATKYQGSGRITTRILTSVSGRSKGASFTPRLFKHGENPGTNCIRGWVNPKACLDAVAKCHLSLTGIHLMIS